MKSLDKSHTVGWDSLEAKAPILNHSCPPSLIGPIFPEGCPHRKKPKVPLLQLTWLEGRGDAALPPLGLQSHHLPGAQRN